MRATDEMVRTAMVKLFSDGVPRTHWHEPVRAALEAALSHAAGQEVASPADHRHAASIDAVVYGTGYLVDGKHVAPNRIEIVHGRPVTAVARSEGEG